VGRLRPLASTPTNGILTAASVAVALAAGGYRLVRAGSPVLTLTVFGAATLAAALAIARSLRPDDEPVSLQSS
jgi:hypothetical protein